MAKSRDEILKLCKRRYIEVDGVRLQSISELERSELQAGNYRRTKDGLELDPEKFATQSARLLALCVVDDEGQRILSNVEAGELDASLSATLNEAARRHCGLDKDEVAREEKNSDATGGSGSPTASP